MGPVTQGTALKIVLVHGVEVGVDEEVSFLARVAAVVVTVTVFQVVSHPIWHVPQDPCEVVVVVVGQHGSLGGTKTVVVSSRMQSGANGQAYSGQTVVWLVVAHLYLATEAYAYVEQSLLCRRSKSEVRSLPTRR